jgi:hypothetical protein
MHRAPAVSWNVGPAAWRLYFLVLWIACGGLVVTLYLVLQPWGIRAATLMLVFLGSVLYAVVVQRKGRSGVLRWDGEHWYWSGFEDQKLGCVICALDLQRRILLHIQDATGKVQWLWLQSGAMDSRWLALRRAIMSTQANNDRLNSQALR